MEPASDVQDDQGSTPLPPGPPGPVSVGDLIETLGSHVLHLVCAPRGTGAPLTGPLVAALDDERSMASDRILLAAHVARSESELGDMVREAGRRGCPAVVVKACGIEPRIIKAAGDEVGVAVFITPEDMSWRHLDRLIAAACHTNLASMRGFALRRSSDLFCLANEIAYAVGGAVTIEDASDRVLAYSNLPH